MSFSRAVIDLLRRKVGTKYQIQRGKLVVGKKLEEKEESSSGLYVVASTKDGKPLRVATDRRVAEVLVDGHYRYLAEGFLLR